MTRVMTIAGAMAFFLSAAFVVRAETGSTTAELDAFWAEVARTVSAGDFSGYAATYHPDAILVSEAKSTSYPIASALSGWEQGFLDTRAGNVVAKVEFRFTVRLHDQTTAHEVGIFHYSAVPVEGDATDQYVHFEALLVKKDGWKMMMEYQQSPATEDEWDAAGE